MQVECVMLTEAGTARVLEGKAGMIFPLEYDGRKDGVGYVHVRDYRYPVHERPYSIWTISLDGVEFDWSLTDIKLG